MPDLLHPDPVLRIDRHQTRFAIGLAFAGGTSGGLFNDALDRAQALPTTWVPASFQGDLFLQNFVAVCLRARIGNDHPVFATAHLLRILAHPPTDRAVVEHRRGILAELAGSPELRSEIERLYVLLCTLRGQLEGINGVGKWDVNRRQLDILKLVRDVFDRMAGFDCARSGLRRLAEFADRIRAGEPYASLAGSAPVRREPGDAEPQDRRRRRRPDPRLRDRLGGRERGEPLRQLAVAALAGQDRALLPRLWLRRRRGDGAAHRGRVRRAAR